MENIQNFDRKEPMAGKDKRVSLATKKRKKLIFYCAMMALPVLQFVFFYFYVNFNSFVLAFQKLDLVGGSGYEFAGMENFTTIFKEVDWGVLIENSMLLFIVMLAFGTVGAVMFSYYIYKKNPGHSIFKIILYSPHIISTVVFALLYNYFIDKAIPAIVGDPNMQPPMNNMNFVQTGTIIFNVWVSFGTQVLMYSGAMSGISESVIESGQLDGITPMKELCFIVLPSIWSTFVTFLIMRVMGIFTEQASLFSFYGADAPAHVQTLGYYLYAKVQAGASKGSVADYNELSAMGMTLTVIAVPVTLAARYCLNKFGPKTE
ncbi:MAG: sugar ABC transporter permease [Clostridia bacterium]|nr:sugar ABC transporter permease [Clostridia bacterium]